MDIEMSLAAIQSEREFDARKAALAARARSEVATDALPSQLPARRWSAARGRVMWLMHRTAATTRDDGQVAQAVR